MKLWEGLIKKQFGEYQETSFEVPSLASICENFIIRHIASFSDVSRLSVMDLANIILKARLFS